MSAFWGESQRQCYNAALLTFSYFWLTIVDFDTFRVGKRLTTEKQIWILTQKKWRSKFLFSDPKSCSLTIRCWPCVLLRPWRPRKALIITFRYLFFWLRKCWRILMYYTIPMFIFSSLIYISTPLWMGLFKLVPAFIVDGDFLLLNKLELNIGCLCYYLEALIA